MNDIHRPENQVSFDVWEGRDIRRSSDKVLAGYVGYPQLVVSFGTEMLEAYQHSIGGVESGHVLSLSRLMASMASRAT